MVNVIYLEKSGLMMIINEWARKCIGIQEVILDRAVARSVLVFKRIIKNDYKILPIYLF